MDFAWPPLGDEVELRIRFAHEAHGADALAVTLGDPAALATRVAARDELRGDLRHQCLEPPVPAALARVELAVRHDDPADVAGSVQPQRARGARAGDGSSRSQCSATRAAPASGAPPRSARA
ncbi:MAG: hypothetical protein IPM22_09235 [Betaproteobacteria bacterium]|nr:hypothetical protein [Betaproteobacteria bacterium]MCC7216873.1 hypothetical protein [Burkholderiales bacterium]